MPTSGVRLVKLNVDEEKMIAAQFRVQQILTVTRSSRASRSPTCPARTEGQLTGAFDQILAQLDRKRSAGEGSRDRATDRDGRAGAGEGDGERAANVFQQIVRWRPSMARRSAARAGAIAAGRLDEARAALDQASRKPP